MHTRTYEDVKKLCIYTEHSDDYQQQIMAYKRHEPSEGQFLIVGTTGIGKTMLTNNYVNELHEHGFKVIFVTSKGGKNEFDATSFMFPPDDEYHLAQLDKQLIKPKIKKVKVYHPLTLYDKIPLTRRMPPINFFSYDIKTMTEAALNSILIGEAQVTLNTCMNIIKRLDDEGSIWDLSWELKREFEKLSEVDRPIHHFDMFTGTKTAGDISTAEKIITSFLDFRDHPFVHEHNSKSNLDFNEILSDQETISVISHKWIDNKRLRFFSYIMFLDNLIKELDYTEKSGAMKHPLCLVFEEIRFLLPRSRTEKEKYEIELAKLLYQTIITVRAKGKGTITVSTTQNYFKSDSNFVEGCDKVILMKLSRDDFTKFQKTLQLNKYQLDTLKSLKRGEFVLLDKLQDESTACDVYLSDVTSFKHPEKDYDFFKTYLKYYGVHAIYYKDWYDELIKKVKMWEEKNKDRLKEAILNEKDILRKKQSEKVKPRVGDVKQERIKERADKEKNAEKLEKMQRAYTIKLQDSNMAFYKICEMINVKGDRAKKYALLWAYRIEDYDFIKKWE